MRSSQWSQDRRKTRRILSQQCLRQTAQAKWKERSDSNEWNKVNIKILSSKLISSSSFPQFLQLEALALMGLLPPQEEHEHFWEKTLLFWESRLLLHLQPNLLVLAILRLEQNEQPPPPLKPSLSPFQGLLHPQHTQSSQLRFLSLVFSQSPQSSALLLLRTSSLDSLDFLSLGLS